MTLVQGHAIGFKRQDNLEVLLHLGIDTVTLNGDPFEIKVKIGDVVKGGDEIALADWHAVAAKNLDTTSVVIFTNTSESLGEFKVEYGRAEGSHKLGFAKSK